MEVCAPVAMKLMDERGDCFKKEFFEVRRSGILDVNIHCLKPVIDFPNGDVRLGYNVGTRSNGTDAPKWPEDLMTEVVK